MHLPPGIRGRPNAWAVTRPFRAVVATAGFNCPDADSATEPGNGPSPSEAVNLPTLTFVERMWQRFR